MSGREQVGRAIQSSRRSHLVALVGLLALVYVSCFASAASADVDTHGGLEPVSPTTKSGLHEVSPLVTKTHDGKYKCSSAYPYSTFQASAFGLAIGNCKAGWTFEDVDYGGPSSEGAYTYGGYAEGILDGCGWIENSRTPEKLSTGESTHCGNGTEVTTPESAFLEKYNGQGIGQSPHDGYFVVNKAPCEEYANYRPWSSGNVETEPLRSVPAYETNGSGAPALKWRYTTKYASTDGTGKYVMVRDERVSGVEGNWVFVPRSCLPATLPENESERNPPPPTVVTANALNIATQNATLAGTVNPNGLETKYFFEYGTTTNYGSYTTTGSAGAGTGAVAEYAPITGLTPGTTYYFRIVASNAIGETFGGPVAFTTQYPAPSVTTESASEIQQTSAKLNGQVNPNGSDTRYYFEYGPTTGYGTRIPSGEGMDIGGGTSPISTWNNVSGLTPGTLYHYRLVASSANATAYGSDQTLYTPGPPRAVTEAATGVKPTEATLNGSVNPNTYATNYYFQYGPTSSYGSIVPTGGAGVGSGTAPVPLSNTITGLAPGSSYHYRIVAENYNGEWGYGEDKAIYTPVARTNVFFADSKHGDTMTNRWYSGGWFETNFGGGEMATGTAASGVMVGGAANVFFVNAGESDKMADRWTSPTGWLQTNFGGDEVAKGTSPGALMVGSEANVFFVDAKEKNTLADWWYHEGWKQSPVGGDEVAAGTSPSGVMIGTHEPNVFFVDAKEKDTLTDWWYHEGWKQSHLGKDEVAKGTSPSAVVVAGNEENVFFVDASKGDTLTDLRYTPGVGWQETNLGGDEVAKGTSPGALMVGSEANVFFVDAKEKNTLADWWYHEGWKQSPFGGDEVAAGTSPSGVMIGTHEPNVFFVDAKEKDTLTDWWYHEGWKQSPFGGDAVAAGSSPSALEE
jgi:hypothetical protein